MNSDELKMIKQYTIRTVRENILHLLIFILLTPVVINVLDKNENDYLFELPAE